MTHAKPHPALYIKSLEALHVTSDHAIAFEDSPNGAVAAKSAGITCVVVPNPLTAHLQFDGVDFRLQSFEDIDLSTLIEVLRGSSQVKCPTCE